METTKQLADRFREVMLSGKWIAFTNFKEQISDLNLAQATKKIGSLNTIAALTFHIDYYVAGLVNYFEVGTLDIKDKYSYDMPPINSEKEWQELKNKALENAEKFAHLVESMPDSKLDEPFVMEKYGDYQKNINGMIEHCYYHFGQIVLIKKMVLETGEIS